MLVWRYHSLFTFEHNFSMRHNFDRPHKDSLSFFLKTSLLLTKTTQKYDKVVTEEKTVKLSLKWIKSVICLWFVNFLCFNGVFQYTQSQKNEQKLFYFLTNRTTITKSAQYAYTTMFFYNIPYSLRLYGNSKCIFMWYVSMSVFVQNNMTCFQSSLLHIFQYTPTGMLSFVFDSTIKTWKKSCSFKKTHTPWPFICCDFFSLTTYINIHRNIHNYIELVICNFQFFTRYLHFYFYFLSCF